MPCDCGTGTKRPLDAQLVLEDSWDRPETIEKTLEVCLEGVDESETSCGNRAALRVPLLLDETGSGFENVSP